MSLQMHQFICCKKWSNLLLFLAWSQSPIFNQKSSPTSLNNLLSYFVIKFSPKNLILILHLSNTYSFNHSCKLFSLHYLIQHFLFPLDTYIPMFLHYQFHVINLSCGSYYYGTYILLFRSTICFSVCACIQMFWPKYL